MRTPPITTPLKTTRIAGLDKASAWCLLAMTFGEGEPRRNPEVKTMKVMVQLEFDGRCRQAFEYYAEVLKGEIKVMNSLGDTQETPLPPGSKPGNPEWIRFAQLQVGDNVIQGNDLSEGDYRTKRGFNIALHVSDASEARRIFDAFADGGQIDTALSEVAWSSAFGIVRDRFDTPWLILALDK